jgi:histidine phosphotransferase ChpT
MGEFSQLSDLDLAALVSSKICHDAIGPMTAIGFGLDVLDEDDDDEQHEMALTMLRNGISAITAKLQFARLAYGAAGSSGFEIDLQEVKTVARNYVESDKKHKVEWTSSIATLPKNHVKLLLNLVAIAVSTVPRGGVIAVTVEGEMDHPKILLRASGPMARVPVGIVDLINCSPAEDVDARSIQPYFAGRIAKATGADISLEMAGDDVLLLARFG